MHMEGRSFETITKVEKPDFHIYMKPEIDSPLTSNFFL